MATHAALGNAYAEPDDGALFRRVLGACLLKAGVILSEDPQTANHANRLIWANAILSQDQQAVFRRAREMKNYALATNADVQFDPANVTDADLTGAVEDGLAVLANGS